MRSRPHTCCRAGSTVRRADDAFHRSRSPPSWRALLVAGCGGDARLSGRRRLTAPPVVRLRIIFPEGFNVREMGDRVAAVRQIAIAKRGGHPEADPRAAISRPSRGRGRRRRSSPTGSAARWRASSSRRSYEFTQFTTGDELVADQLTAFRKAFARVNLSYARSKNLTPYDVLKIASMIEKETVAPRRAQARRGGDLQPPAQQDAARHRCHDPLRPRHPGHGVADEGGDSRATARTTAAVSRVCRRRRSRTRASPRSRPPRTRRPSTTSTTSASRGRSATSSPPARASSCARSASSATPATDGPLRGGESTLATWLSPVSPAVSRSRRRRRFCSACGAAQHQACPSCGTEQPAGASFCSACGATLRGGARRAADGDEREERRIVSVLFADLAGSTALGERLDPEEVRELQGELFALVNGQVERFGGVTEKFVGDAVLAVFGIPQAHEDDPERAVLRGPRRPRRLRGLRRADRRPARRRGGAADRRQHGRRGRRAARPLRAAS